MIKVRKALVKDTAALKDLDLKSYEYPLTPTHWEHFRGFGVAYIATIGSRNVGYALLEDLECSLTVLRLGARPEFRGLGVGKCLLAEAEALAYDLHKTKLTTVIPEINCLPGHPDDVSLWLKWQGFRAHGLKAGLYWMYGECVDGILFSKEL